MRRTVRILNDFRNLDLKEQLKKADIFYHITTKEGYNFAKKMRLHLSTFIMRQNLIANHQMIKPRTFVIPVTRREVTFTLSNVCGHGAFLMLALSYLETEFLNLRTEAAAGILLSIMFQYYRPVPLSIPIKWNSLFLLINLYMIAAIFRDSKAADRLPDEQKKLYLDIFAKHNMTPVEFLKLISIAKRLEVPAGEKLVIEGQFHHHLYLMVDGHVRMMKDGDIIGDLGPKQFVGAMSFLLWEELAASRLKDDRVTHTLKELEQWNSQSLSGDENGNIRQFIDGLREVYRYYKSSTLSQSDRELMSSVAEKNASKVGATEKKAELGKGGLGQANVISMEPCVLYRWRFEDLHEAICWSPRTGAAVESSISADLNNKMIASWSSSRRHMYKKLLLAVLSDNMCTEGQRRYLEACRIKQKITIEDHREILREMGWTEEEFMNGKHITKYELEDASSKNSNTESPKRTWAEWWQQGAPLLPQRMTPATPRI